MKPDNAKITGLPPVVLITEHARTATPCAFFCYGAFMAKKKQGELRWTMRDTAKPVTARVTESSRECDTSVLRRISRAAGKASNQGFVRHLQRGGAGKTMGRRE